MIKKKFGSEVGIDKLIAVAFKYPHSERIAIMCFLCSPLSTTAEMLFGKRSDSDTEVLDLLENSTALVNHHNADGASPVSLLTWEHDAKLQNFPESPKSPRGIPCLSVFQTGYTLGNIKTAEVRKCFVH